MVLWSLLKENRIFGLKCNFSQNRGLKCNFTLFVSKWSKYDYLCIFKCKFEYSSNQRRIMCPKDLFVNSTKLGDQFVIFTKLRGQIVIFQKSFLLCLFNCLFEICDLIVFCIRLNFVNSISFIIVLIFMD